MSNKIVFRASAKNFCKIPGSPIAYWVGEKMIRAFACKPIGDFGTPSQGMSTCDVNRFVRQWYEVSVHKTNILYGGKACWVRYNKGGDFRRWYGNRETVVRWENDGSLLKSSGALLRNSESYFKPFIAWSKISSQGTGFRCFEEDFLFDGAGGSLFLNDADDSRMILGFLNSVVAWNILNLISPTINYNESHIGNLPFYDSTEDRSGVECHVAELVALSRSDWDEYETSWDFKVNPLVREGWQRNGSAMSLETAWAAVFARRMEWAARMKALEEENNRLFIKAYGLEDELKPDVEWKDVSITGNPFYRYKVDAGVDAARPESAPYQGVPPELEAKARADAMRELISYGMGVLMGRYSLEQEGLILASQGELYKDYLARVHGAGKILPDEDGVIPAISLEGNFFRDNLLHRMREFLSVAFGNDTLPKNLNFIEAALGCGFDKYLTDKFFDDHVKTYKKRPIYWLFESPKGYFRAFAYMHRMTGATAGHIRNNYLLPYIGHLEKCFAAESAKGSSMTSAERKRVKAMEAAIKDCKAYDLVLHDFADRAVAIDLDDGVVVNWAKYKEVLASL